MSLSIVFFQGYNSPYSKEMIVDIHVVDERGRTQKIFPSPHDKHRGVNARPLSARLDEARDWINSQ